MPSPRLDVLIWVLVYGGLLAVCLGLATWSTLPGLGLTLLIGGGVATAAGVVAFVVRSRRPD